MQSYRRQLATPIIGRVLAETAGKSAKEVRDALRRTYPFGVRWHYPYRIWCDEIRVQTGKKQLRALDPDPRQAVLFA